MKTKQTRSDGSETIYALLVRSEEKNRNRLELAIYPLLAIGTIIAICQFVFQPLTAFGTIC